MKNVSDIRGTDAILALAEMLEPISVLAKDDELIKIANNESIGKALSIGMKRYPKEVLQIMAATDGEEVENYNPSLTEIPIKLMDIARDEGVKKLFFSQAQKVEQKPSGDVSESTME